MTRGERAIAARAGALAILLALAAAVWLGPVAAYRDLLAGAAEEIDAKAAVLQRYRALARPAGERAARPTGEAGVLLPEVPDSQAAAILQETVKSAAAASQIQVQGLQVLRSETSSGAVRIGVRVRAAGDIANIGRLLHAIETARPLLYPDNLQIQAHGAARNAAPAPIDFQLDISGFKSGAAL